MKVYLVIIDWWESHEIVGAFKTGDLAKEQANLEEEYFEENSQTPHRIYVSEEEILDETIGDRKRTC